MPNRLTRAAREAFELAFQELGDVEALTKWAHENQTEFYKLYARLIPIEQRHASADGKPVEVERVIRFVE